MTTTHAPAAPAVVDQLGSDEVPVTARCQAPSARALVLAAMPRPIARAAIRSDRVRGALACGRRQVGAFVSTWCTHCLDRHTRTWCTDCTRQAHAGTYTYRAWCPVCDADTAIVTVAVLDPAS